FLAEYAEAPLDYSVFSVVIVTLCIVLVVEVLRHQLDVAASGNPFFQTVLELMYREQFGNHTMIFLHVAISEFFIYLLHKYDENFNYAMEVVFIDVHFMLFYTALFNAIQSVLVRLVTARRTDKAWIQTEDIDIGHYVAIRKEFDRVENEWRQLQYPSSEQCAHSEFNRSSSCNISSEENEQDSDKLSVLKSFRKYIHDSVTKLRYPRLYLRKRKLLVPVRYHELRCHFIEQNGLSSQFKVSQYLKRSLTSVLLDFVHISSVAWVMLMATGILIYYISGIILHASEDKMKVLEFMIWVLASLMTIFLVISIVLFFKMRSIFSKILVMKLTIDDEDNGTKSWRGFTALRTEMNLFWGGNPRVIIVLTQFMQFGYALGLAAIFTYWQQFESQSFDYKDRMLVALLISYGIFLHLLADILPWFTLCTSMGQLVNKERLHETMAKVKLSEEIRKAEAAAEAAAIEEEISSRRRRTEEKLMVKSSNDHKKEQEIARIKDLHQFQSLQLRTKGRERSLSGGVGLLRIFHDECVNSSDSTRQHGKRKSISDGVQLMSKLRVSRENLSEAFNCSARLSDAAAEHLWDTREVESLPTDAPTEKADGCLVPQNAVGRNMQDTYQRTLSGNKAQPGPDVKGAPLSRAKSGAEVFGATDDSANSTPIAQKRNPRFRTTKSKSEGVAFMRSCLDPVNGVMPLLPALEVPKKEPKLETLPESVHAAAKALPEISEWTSTKCGAEPMETDPKSSSTPMSAAVNSNGASAILTMQERKQRRRAMCKSEGVALMRSSFDRANVTLSPLEGAKKDSRLETLSELVHMPAKDLPEIPERSKLERKSRLKAISDGVSSMGTGLLETDLKSTHSLAVSNVNDSNVNSMFSSQERKQRRRATKCKSEGVALMRSSLDRANPILPTLPPVEESNPESKLKTLSELVHTSSKDLPEIQERKATQGKSRLRAISDGVSSMRAGPIETIRKLSSETSHIANHIAVQVGAIQGEPPNEMQADASSFNSEESVNGESDIDDVPDVISDGRSIITRNTRKLSHIDLVAVFQSLRYKSLSLLFGPMVCCFLVARVEGFNIASGVLIDYSSTFQFGLVTSFWLETVSYCLMMFELFVALAVFMRACNLEGILTAAIGIFINVTCLLLLMVSEIQRCCPNEDSDEVSRLLVSVTHASSTAYNDSCCDKFGQRTYGGLGRIEPYTFLIALSPLRFVVGGTFARLCGMKVLTESTRKSHIVHDHHHASDPDQVRDIWLSTIGSHSDIAKKYGLFSVEILYCMLGIQDFPLQRSREAFHGGVPYLEDTSPQDSVPQDSSENAEVCEITSNCGTTPPALKNSFGIVFDQNIFAFPSSKLIRRMRRCEGKLLPLLDKWMLVDVVLTNHELVIFEVPDDDSLPLRTTNSAISFSDGGRGLSLVDVAIGRRVLSQFLIDDIDFIDIEHSLAISGDGEIEDIESNHQDVREFWQGFANTVKYDFIDMSKRWSRVDEDRLKIHFTNGCGTLYLRLLVDLKEKESSKNSRQLQGESCSLLATVGTETKIWCRTIARLRGATNLRMSLPHFGGTGADEIEDFIRITDRDSAGKKQHRRGLSRFLNNLES
ncbi:hypothetical protein HJC23_007137, partial [Cyclotella cryptica]